MTPAMPIADANASGDLNSLIDSSIDSVNTEPSVEPSEPAVETAPAELDEPVAEPPAEEAQVEEQPPVEETKPEEDEADPNDDLSKPDRLSKDGKLLYYKQSRIQKFLQSHQAWNAVQDVLPGASVDSIRELANTAAGAEQLSADLDAGNYENVLGFLAADPADPSGSAISPQVAAGLATSMLPFLASKAPEALKQIESKILNVQVKQLYREAQSKGDEKLLKLAQNLDYRLTGKFMNPAQVAQQDPFAEREAAIARREQEFQQRTMQEQRQRTEAAFKDIQSAAEKAVDEVITAKIPEGVRKAFAGKPQERWIARDLREKVEEAFNANTTFKRQYDTALAKAQARPSEQNRQALVSMKRQFTEAVVAKNIKATIEAATGTVMSASAAAHSKQAAAAAKREPANAGAPIQGASIPKGVNDAKSMDDVFKAIGW